ncbi:MAG: hypothetical protein AB7W28_11275 [Armatimonadota bacterium]
MSAVFDTLTPFARGDRLNGVDLSYSDSPAWMFAVRDLGVNFL